MFYQTMSNGGKTKCKYYKVCGNIENCKRCNAFEKENKNGKNDK